MTLMNDNLEGVKASLLVAIKNELVETYPKEFGDYRTSRDDIFTKVYWDDTIRNQPTYPHCTLTQQREVSEGYDEIVHFRRADGVYVKRVINRSLMTVTINVLNMGNEAENISSLQADTFAHKVARQLKKYFNGDDKLDWFSGNEYYPRQIGITVQTDIQPIIEWNDTDTKFRYAFDIQLGWDDVIDTETEPAKGVEISIDENGKELERFKVTLEDKGEI